MRDLNNLNYEHDCDFKNMLRSIKCVIDYIYDDELNDYNSSTKKETHIFNDVDKVDNWLKENNKN
jgi:hypothetical protein